MCPQSGQSTASWVSRSTTGSQTADNVLDTASNSTSQDFCKRLNVQAFDTANVALVEGLMWTAIAAAALKRFWAHMTQLLTEVPMSTRKVAMCALHVLGDLVEALKRGDVVGLSAALEAAITSLARHAQRAHPKRDRQTGRAQLGLEPCFEHDDVIECAKAA